MPPPRRGSIYTGEIFQREATGQGAIHYPEGGECCAFDYNGEVLLMQPQGEGRAVYSLSSQDHTLPYACSHEGWWEKGMVNGRDVVRSFGEILHVGSFRESGPVVCTTSLSLISP